MQAYESQTGGYGFPAVEVGLKRCIDFGHLGLKHRVWFVLSDYGDKILGKRLERNNFYHYSSGLYAKQNIFLEGSCLKWVCRFFGQV